MNGQTDIPTPLDQRAQAAAASLRAEAAIRPRPDFDPGRMSTPAPASGRGRARGPALIAAAAVLVLLIGAVALLVVRSGDDETRPTTSTGGEPRGFLSEDPPAGLRLGGAGEVSRQDAAAGPQAPLDLYGPSEADPRLGIAAFPGDETEFTDGEPIDVGGRPGMVHRNQGLGPLAVTTAVDGQVLVGISPSLDPDRLAEVLAATTMGVDAPVVDVAALPDGWRRLGREPSLVGLVSPVAAGRGSVGPSRLAYYAGGDPTDVTTRSAVVQSIPGDAGTLHAPRLVLDDVEEVEVRGHRGFLGRMAYRSDDLNLDSWVVTWTEAPGEIVRASAVGISRDEALALARSLAPVEESRWRTTVEDTQLGAYDGDPSREIVGDGRFADGTRWRLDIDPSGDAGNGLVLHVALVGDTNSSFNGSGEAIGSIPDAEAAADPLGLGMPFRATLGVDGRVFAYGQLGDHAATVEAVASDGSRLADAEVVEGAGVRAFVVEVTGAPASIVVRTGDGAELARWAVSDDTVGSKQTTGPASATTMAGG